MTRPPIDHTHAAGLSSWIAGADAHAEFPPQNLPLGIFRPRQGAPRAGFAIGDQILDLRAAALAGLLPATAANLLGEPTLNVLLAAAPAVRLDLRHAISRLVSDPAFEGRVRPLLHAAPDCEVLLPATVGDYTDFYAGIHHAENVGRLFRPDNPLLPNYKYVPIGYHGRASSVRASGGTVIRPGGQLKGPDDTAPSFGPSRRLDYELELGAWVGQANSPGEPIVIGDAQAHIAGYSLLNDWSARDLQAWEYQPLGPFLSKSFHTTVSPWIVTSEALAPFYVAQAPRPHGDPMPLPYLWDDADQAGGALAVALSVELSTAAMRMAGLPPHRLALSDARSMYWTFAQLVAHHASNGCDLRPGDLLGSGTLSGPDATSLGSLLEMTRGGAQPITLANGETRTFLQDGDEVRLTGHARADGFVAIGFGACVGQVAARR